MNRNTVETFGLDRRTHEADVAHVTIGGRNIVGQISVLPDNSGFLIRVWPPNGTHEHGGSNGTTVSLVVKYDADDQPCLESFNWSLPFRSDTKETQ